MLLPQASIIRNKLDVVPFILNLKPELSVITIIVSISCVSFAVFYCNLQLFYSRFAIFKDCTQQLLCEVSGSLWSDLFHKFLYQAFSELKTQFDAGGYIAISKHELTIEHWLHRSISSGTFGVPYKLPFNSRFTVCTAWK